MALNGDMRAISNEVRPATAVVKIRLPCKSANAEWLNQPIRSSVVYPAGQNKTRLHIRNRVRCSFGNSINQQEASHVAKRVKVRWSAGRNYRDPNDVVEVPDDATDEEIEKALGGRHGKLEPMVTASAKASDETSIVLARGPRGKLKIGIPLAAKVVTPS
jgi:hypothetical protein